MTTLVTGSKGFIGKAYMDKYPSYGVDLKDGNSVLDLVEDLKFPVEIDSIIHLAAISGILDCQFRPYHAVKTNILGLAATLELAREKKSKVILASSAAASNPSNPYAVTKLAGEAMLVAWCKTYDIKYTCLRFANVYGPGSMEKSSVVAKMIRDAIYLKKITIFGDGKQARDFVYIDDIVNAIHICTKEPIHGVVNVGTGILTQINEIAEYISLKLKVGIVYEKSPRGIETTPEPDDLRRIKCETPWKEGVDKTIEYFKELIK